MVMNVQGPGGLQIQFPDGTDRNVISSVMQQAYQKQQSQAAPKQPDSSVVGSIFRGVRDTALAGWGDELSAASGAVGNKIGNYLGMNKSTANFGQVYSQLLDQEHRQQQADADQHPIARAYGQAGGLTTALVAPGLRAAKGANLLTKAGVAIANGAGYGAVSGAGNANPGSREHGAAIGAATGAVAGAVLAPVAAVAGKVAGPVIQDFVSRAKDGENAGIAALGRRTTLDPQVMADTAAKYRAAGVTPTLTDVVTPQARSVISTAGETAPNGGQLVDQATGRVADVQSRVADQARANIAGGTDTAATLAPKLAAARSALSDEAYTAARHDPVPLTPDIKATLATKEGQNAITGAMGLESDPAAQKQLADIRKWAITPDQPDVPPELQGLSPAAQQQAMAQMGITPPAPPPFTAGMAQRVISVLRDAADSGAAARTPRRAAVLGNFADTIQQHAEENSPTLMAAREQHAAASAPINALETGAQFTGKNAGGAQTPEVAENLAATQATDNPLTQSAARVAARDQVVEQAGRSPAAALGVADQISQSANQAQRNAALLGQEAGDKLAETMGIEASRVRNAKAAAPGAAAGNPNVDAANLDAIIAHAATGGKSGVIYAMRRFMAHQGISGFNAERLVNDATNPARVDAAIQYLSSKIGKQRATSLVGSLAKVGGNISGMAAGATSQ